MTFTERAELQNTYQNQHRLKSNQSQYGGVSKSGENHISAENEPGYASHIGVNNSQAVDLCMAFELLCIKRVERAPMICFRSVLVSLVCASLGCSDSNDLTTFYDAAQSKRRQGCVEFKDALWQVVIEGIYFDEELTDDDQRHEYFVRIPHKASTSAVKAGDVNQQGNDVIYFKDNGTAGIMFDGEDPRDRKPDSSPRLFLSAELNMITFDIIRIEHGLDIENPFGGHLQGLDWADKDTRYRCIGANEFSEAIYYDVYASLCRHYSVQQDVASCDLAPPRILYDDCEMERSNEIEIEYWFETDQSICTPANPQQRSP